VQDSEEKRQATLDRLALAREAKKLKKQEKTKNA
jgi:hypothetical protein